MSSRKSVINGLSLMCAVIASAAAGTSSSGAGDLSNLLSDKSNLSDLIAHPVDPDDTADEMKKRGIRIPRSLPSACTAEASSFLTAYRRAGEPDDLEHIRQTLSDQIYAAEVVAYSNACFTPASATPKGFETAQAAVGALIDPGDKQTGGPYAFCMAFLIKPNELLTARHCFFDVDTNAPTRDPRSVEFHSFLMPDSGTPITALQTASSDVGRGKPGHFAPQDDFVFLSVPASSATPFVLAPASINAASVVPGINGYLPGTWKESLSWTKPDSGCRVVWKTGLDCYVHVCQTAPGFSGSPILQLNSRGQVVAVGMHLGSTAMGGCDAPDGQSASIALPVNNF